MCGGWTAFAEARDESRGSHHANFALARLSRVELSYAFPFLSLAFVAIMLGARFGLAESLPRHRILGSAFIVLGVVLVGLSGK